MMDGLNLNRLAYFVAVVDCGGFTRAAERMGVAKALVSRQVASLEAEIGTSLLVRTTRRVEPTDAGRAFHRRAAQILREADDAFAEVAQANAEPRGTLRLTAPHDYGTSVVVPTVMAFLARYPACRADLRLNDRTLDLMSGELDLSIRVGWLADSSLRARRIGNFEQILVASPILADRLVPVAQPEDLTILPFIANARLRDPLVWEFSCKGRESQTLRAAATLTLDTTQAAHAAVLAGAGLTVLPDFVVAKDLAAGHLLHALPDWQLPSGGVHAVFPTGRFRPSRVTAFVEMLVARRAKRDAF
jgi:DNA-binding transcriptional LysR family regulator